MDAENRKIEIRRRLNLAQYSRRANALFTNENNHNPLVLSECLDCRGVGTVGIYIDKHTEADDTCATCVGTGLTGETELYFQLEFEMQAAESNEFGWIQCPNCHTSFMLTDKNA